MIILFMKKKPIYPKSYFHYLSCAANQKLFKSIVNVIQNVLILIIKGVVNTALTKSILFLKTK